MDKPMRRADSESNEGQASTGSDYEMIQSTNVNGTTSTKGKQSDDSASNNGTRKNRPFAGREVNLRFLIGDQHTTSNKKGIAQVNIGPKPINSVADFGGIYEMAKYHTGEVDEYLATQEKGILEPPNNSTHEELIKFRFKDRPVHSKKDQVRSAVLCENQEGADFAANDKLTRQTVNQSANTGANTGANAGTNTGANTGANRGQSARNQVNGFSNRNGNNGYNNGTKLNGSLSSLFGSNKSNNSSSSSLPGADSMNYQNTSAISKKVKEAVNNALSNIKKSDRDSKDEAGNKEKQILKQQKSISTKIKEQVRLATSTLETVPRRDINNVDGNQI